MKETATAAVERLRNYIGGQWVDAPVPDSEPLYNPATGEVIAAVPMSDASDVDRAVQAAEAAFDAWRETPVLRRARVMFRYKQLLEEHKEELAAIITREHGKTLADARAELERGIEVVEFATGIPTLLMGKTLEQVGTDVDVDMYPAAARDVRRHLPVQFSRHDSDVDVSSGHRVRKHVRVEAVGAYASNRDAAG